VEYEVFLLEQLESVILDDDDHFEMPPRSSAMVPMSKILATTIGASSSAPSQTYASTSTLPPCGGPHNTCSNGRRMG
jgi:hypothetical protein